MTKLFFSGLLMLSSVSLVNLAQATESAVKHTDPQAKASQFESKMRREKRSLTGVNKADYRLAKSDENRKDRKHERRSERREKAKDRREKSRERRQARREDRQSRREKRHERRHERRHEKKHRRYSKHRHDHGHHKKYRHSHKHHSHKRRWHRGHGHYHYNGRHVASHSDYYGTFYGYYDIYGNYHAYDYGYYDRRGRYHPHYHSRHCGHVKTPLLGAVVAGILISRVLDH